MILLMPNDRNLDELINASPFSHTERVKALLDAGVSDSAFVEASRFLENWDASKNMIEPAARSKGAIESRSETVKAVACPLECERFSCSWAGNHTGG
jgi:hypothetical protein